MKVTRPLLRYHGGKWKLAPWIIDHLPHHRIYVEPYGGAASVLLRKPRSYSEVYNDLDGEVVNLFRVLRNPAQARELIRLISLTPYAREEYDGSFGSDPDPIERARRTLVRSGMSSSSGILTRNKGFRADTKERSPLAHEWPPTIKRIEQAMTRLQGVIIENRPALQVIQRHDAADTLHYVDPPYIFDTRGVEAGSAYLHDMSDAEHIEMAETLRTLDGMVVLSGYRCDLYDDLFAGWQRVDRSTHADGARDRVECLWISPNAVQRPTLFVEATR